MNKIKLLKYNKIQLNGVLYNPYKVGELPQRFAFIYNADKDQEGISRFFNFKGLTYIKDKD